MEGLSILLSSLQDAEREIRWGFGIEERHERYVLERAHHQWLFEERSASASLAPAADDVLSVTTVFRGNVLPDTFVKPTARLGVLEAKLVALNGSACAMTAEALPSINASAGVNAGPMIGLGIVSVVGGQGYQFRLIQRREGNARDAVEKEESDDFKRLRAQCGRGMLGIIGAIMALPDEMRQLAMLRLRDDERQAFMLKPTIGDEHKGRTALIFIEREEFLRYLILKNEDAMILNISSRFHSVKASIASFLRAQWLVQSISARNTELRSRFYTSWMRYASSTQRLRRIVLGLNRIRKASERQLVYQYASQWNHPIQDFALALDTRELVFTEHELREHMHFYEEECRARSCAEAMESVLYNKIVEEHFAVIGPLIEARRSAAALELEMLNAARLAKLRLQTWYFWTVDRRNEAKVNFIREKAMFYSAQTRFTCWYMWTERRFVTRYIEESRRLQECEMVEDVTRLVTEARLTVRHASLIRRAVSGPRAHDIDRIVKQLTTIAKVARLQFGRRYFERWLMFASRNNIESRALFLSRISQHVITTRYYWLWAELHGERRHCLGVALGAEGAARCVIACDEQEEFDRLAIEYGGLVGFLRVRRLVRRVADVTGNAFVDPRPLPSSNKRLGMAIDDLAEAADMALLAAPEEAVATSPNPHANIAEGDTVSQDVPAERMEDRLGMFDERAEDDENASCSAAAITGFTVHQEWGGYFSTLSLPKRLGALRPLPVLDGTAADIALCGLRFHTLLHYASRRIRHRSAYSTIHVNAEGRLAARAWWKWQMSVVLRVEESKRTVICAEEAGLGYELFRGIREDIISTIADAKTRAASQLAMRNELQAMVEPFRRFMALVHRRVAARAKRPDALLMARRLEGYLLARFMQYWRKVVSRARVRALARRLGRQSELLILRRYWDRFPPSLLRIAKVSKVRQDLHAAQTAAAELEDEGCPAVGPAKGSALANKLMLKRQPNHVFL